MGLPESSHLAKANAVFAFAAFVVYIVGFASPNWLNKSFDYPVNIGDIKFLPIRANIGLFTACKVETYRNNKTTENCSPEGAADWQIVSAAMAIAGLVFALVGVTLGVLRLVLTRLCGKMKVQLGVLLCHFIACDFIVGPLLMFPINKTIVVKPTLSNFQVDFDLGWSYQVAGVSAGLFALLILLNIIDLIGSCDKEKKQSKYRNI